MSAFWIATALMTAATVAVVVFPLLRASGQQKAKRAEYDITVYKDQLAEIDRDFERGLLAEAEADAARIEIQRRMLKAAAPSVEDTAAGKAKPAPTRSIALTGLLAVGVTAGAFGLYAYKGSPEMSDRPYASRDIAAEITAREGRLERREVMQLIARLLETMKKRPDDIRGWILLARTYMTISEFEGAMGAFKRAVDLSNRDPEVVADYAEAMILAQDGNIPETAKTLYAEILTKDPYNPKAGHCLG
ncbi:MAG: c-type cytochrome biogenesis protein CcmI, partial [Alphaproteobacteria bacterium]|nr:c-type cytochrome biogenesis protein CcmI [Alphaproteobacteria bacterium]